MRRFWMVALLLSPLVACEEEVLILQSGPGQGIVVVSSDFADTTVSLVDRLSRETVVEEIISSAGTAALGSPLSGDVGVAGAPNPFGGLVLLDRSNGNVTLLDTIGGAVEAQYALRSQLGDPNPNPADVLVYSATKAYVTRQGRCIAATPDPFGLCDLGTPTAFDNERSNDVVLLNPQTGALTEVTAFDFNSVFGGTHVDTSGGDFARPSRLIWTGRYLLVILLNLDSGFDGTGGPGLVALIDPTTDILVDATPDGSAGTVDPIVLDAGGGDVCQGPGAGAHYVASQDALYIACQGIFGSFSSPENGDHADQLDASRIVRVDLSPLFNGGDVVVTSVAAAEDFYPGATPTTARSPLGQNVQIVSPTLGFVLIEGTFGCNFDFGDMTPCSPDASAPPQSVMGGLYTFNPMTGAANTTPLLSVFPFSFGNMLLDSLTNTLYVADASFGASAVRVYDVDGTDNGDGSDLSDTAEDALAAFVPNPRPDQAPRTLGFY